MAAVGGAAAGSVEGQAALAESALRGAGMALGQWYGRGEWLSLPWSFHWSVVVPPLGTAGTDSYTAHRRSTSW
jgi:hypothetical protein